MLPTERSIFLQMDVSAEKNTDEAWAVKEIMRKKGLKAVQAKVAKYIADLKEGISHAFL